ncbi:hypothetical protein VTO42DRAFT_971 [Malbranchea cinnamomea]
MSLRKKYPELVFKKQNKDLKKLPQYARIEKRPIPHPPAASPYAGSQVPKVVYVSTKTPFMSAVKRVQKLLKEAEKRAVARVNLSDKNEKRKLEHLKEGTSALQKEEVFIKATGRAIEKAMNVGKWFDAKDEYSIRVKTGSVLVVDDIIEDEELKEKLRRESKSEVTSAGVQISAESTKDTSLEDKIGSIPQEQSSKKGKKRARVEYEAELPDSRTRWVNMVEIAVTLK